MSLCKTLVRGPGVHSQGTCYPLIVALIYLSSPLPVSLWVASGGQLFEAALQ